LYRGIPHSKPDLIANLELHPAVSRVVTTLRQDVRFQASEPRAPLRRCSRIRRCSRTFAGILTFPTRRSAGDTDEFEASGYLRHVGGRLHLGCLLVAGVTLSIPNSRGPLSSRCPTSWPRRVRLGLRNVSGRSTGRPALGARTHCRSSHGTQWDHQVFGALERVRSSGGQLEGRSAVEACQTAVGRV